MYIYTHSEKSAALHTCVLPSWALCEGECVCVCVCVCVCIYIHVYVYRPTHMYICIYVECVYTCVYIYTYIHTYIYIHICICTCIHIYIYIYIYTHTYTYIYIYIYMYIYTHIHVYIYTFIYIYSTVLSSFASSDSPSQRVATMCKLPFWQVSLEKEPNFWRQRGSLEKETSKYREPTTNWWRFVGSWQCQVSFANKHFFVGLFCRRAQIIEGANSGSPPHTHSLTYTLTQMYI